MKGYVGNIEEASKQGGDFRKVLYTGKHSQLVIMSVPPGGEIGTEVHEVDQFLRIDQGSGVAILDGVEHAISDGFAILVPAGTEHNIKNTGAEAMKLYTVYSPPEHKKDTVHPTKAIAEADTADHFDGQTTE